MPATLSRILHLIQSGTAEQLRKALNEGFTWPKDPARHPVLDLLDQARMLGPYAKQMPEKLDALLAHGMPVDFSIPFGTNIGPSRREVATRGITTADRGKPLMGATLLERAAALGLSDLAGVLLAHGAEDPEARARELAAQNGQTHTLRTLLDAVPREQWRWERWGPALLRQRHKLGAAEFDLLGDYLPDAVDLDRVALALESMRDTGVQHGVAQWLEHDPALWARLHDTPCAPTRNGRVPSLWPVALSEYHRREYPRIFEQAVAHMRDRQPAWRTLPVSRFHGAQWGPRDSVEDHQFGGIPGWRGRGTLLPPLQTLLHGRHRMPRGRSELRQWMRDARTLMQAGCALWAGGGEAGHPQTEQMLWALSHKAPDPRWLAKHPQFLAPHIQTGQTPLHVVRDTRTADHWISAGVDPAAVDAQGNQALATLLPMAAKTSNGSGSVSVSKPSDWVAWIKHGWKQRGFPVEGRAWGASTAELACVHPSLHAALPARVRRNMPRTGHGLHWASLYGNAPVVQALLDAGHDPTVLDGAGRTPLLCLAMATLAMHTDAEEKSLAQCVDIALEGGWPDETHAAWDYLIHPTRMTAVKDTTTNKKSLVRIFHHLKQQRIAEPTLWRAQDTTALLESFQEETDLLPFRNLTRDLPVPVLNDLLLALHDPARWPEMERTVFAFGPRMAEHLVKLGADYMATSLTGERLCDGWARLEARERSLQGTSLASLLLTASLTQGPARAAMEQQRLELDTHEAAEPSGRRLRL